MKQLTITTNPDGETEAHYLGERLYRWQNVIQARSVLREIQAKGWELIYEK